jgi:hypothetical protein
MSANTLLVLGNLAVLFFFGYVVFFRDASPWWMVVPFVFNFSRSKS